MAEKLAEKNGCGAIITGESLGQVASQTMESINSTNSVIKMPVFRPLIGYDKIEIIDIAKNIGTYDLSILPFEDCCTVFTPQDPVIRPKLEEVQKIESVLDVNKLVDDAVNGVETIVLPFLITGNNSLKKMNFSFECPIMLYLFSISIL
ncbi:MAG: hypothetical protein ACOX2Y_01540 [Christensenellales bacterium]